MATKPYRYCCVPSLDVACALTVEGAIATGTIAIAGILIAAVAAKVLLASPGVIANGHRYRADTAILGILPANSRATSTAGVGF